MALLRDFRLAARILARNKASTLIALLALALGLGANVAIFSVVGLMIQVPLPYPEPASLVHIPQTNPALGFSQASVSLQDVHDWQAAAGIASIAAYRSRPMAFSGEGEPQQLPAMQATPEFFRTLGVKPSLGRGFSASETPATEARVAVISHALWQGMYRGDPSVLGRDIRLNGRNYAIVGVMPPDFHFLYRKSDLWIPLSLEPAQRERGWRSMSAIARLKRGVSLDQAAAQVRAISDRVAREDPKSSENWRGEVRPLSDRVIPKGARASAATMFGAVGFVLLIACANVASLQLARGMLRRREFALRASLGAGRAALVRLQLAESLLLSLAGGAVGVLASYWTVPLLKRVAPPEMEIFKIAHVDPAALAFGLALSLFTGVIFGIVPAWILTRGSLAESLHDSSRGSTSRRNLVLKALVVAEMTLALVLVSGGAMMIRSLIRQQTMDPGFDRSNVTGAEILLPQARYPEPAQIAGFYAQTLEILERDSGVESAALVQTLPLTGDNSYLGVRVEGQSDPREDSIAGNMIVSPGYFRTLRIPVIAGREFTSQDQAAAQPVAIVNETFVRRYWPTESLPLGRRVKIGDDKSPWLTVVGISRDVKHNGLSDPPRAEVYRPHAQAPEARMMLLARARSASLNPAVAMRSAVWQVDREQPLYRLQTLDAYFLTRSSGALATTKVLGGLALIALILAAIGTYSVMAYTAAQRLRELGIRIALGASAPSVFSLVLKGGLALAAIGLAIGLPAAYGVTPLLRMATDGLEPHETTVYAGVAALLFLVTLAASAAPAIRAMRVDPATVLRAE
jgi:predicted permease